MSRSSAASEADLLIAAKSTWIPAIRREHALAKGVVAVGRRVTFVERPSDIRAIRPGNLRDFAVGLCAQRKSIDMGPHLSVQARNVFLPAHRGKIAEYLDGQGLARALRAESPDAALVVTTPWQWAAGRVAGQRRRVADFGDDWSTLIPRAAASVRRWHEMIAAEADEVIVASPGLMDSFPGRSPRLIRNATDDALIESPTTAPPRQNRMVYVGTLSERFDAPLLARVLDALPEWQLDLWGPCQYAGHGDQPGPELRDLLARGPDRVRWHGPAPRKDLARILDTGDVLVLPNRPSATVGQDSMKAYDYSARGRPLVSTELPELAVRPPLLAERSDVDGWVDALLAASGELDDEAVTAERSTVRRDWASRNTWSTRVPEWWATVNGIAVPS
jgi:glycosyltransferase involved in cell wall biosynthesis